LEDAARTAGYAQLNRAGGRSIVEEAA